MERIRFRRGERTENGHIEAPGPFNFQTLCNLNEYFSDFDSTWKLTEQAKDLSEEETQCLEMDIFKPLDFYEILFDRMKITNNVTSSEHPDGQ